MPLEDEEEPVINGRYVQVKIRASEIVTLGLTPER
jgi:hypothetical protein